MARTNCSTASEASRDTSESVTAASASIGCANREKQARRTNAARRERRRVRRPPFSAPFSATVFETEREIRHPDAPTERQGVRCGSVAVKRSTVFHRTRLPLRRPRVVSCTDPFDPPAMVPPRQAGARAGVAPQWEEQQVERCPESRFSIVATHVRSRLSLLRHGQRRHVASRAQRRRSPHTRYRRHLLGVPPM